MKIFKSFFAAKKRRAEMKEYQAQIDVLEEKVSDFIYDKSGKYHPIPRIDLTERLPELILSKDDAVNFFAKFLGEKINPYEVSLVNLTEAYGNHASNLCWVYRSFLVNLTKGEYGYYSERMFSKLVIIDKGFNIPVAAYTDLRVLVRGEEIFPIDIIYDEWGEVEHIEKTLKVYSAQTPMSKVLEDIKKLS